MLRMKNKIYKLLICLTIFLFGIITYTTIFDIYVTEIAKTELSNIFVLIGSIIYLCFLCFVYKVISRVKEKKCDLIVLLITIFSFLILILWGTSHKILPLYDLNHIIDIVNNLLNNSNHIVGYNEYLSMYPHQIPLVILVYLVEFVGNILKIKPDSFMVVYNSFMISLMFFFTYKTIKKMFNYKIAFIGFLLLVLTPDFYLYSSYYYTDIISIPFAIIGFYNIMKAEESKSRKSRILYYILSGVMFAIGFKIRVVTVFLLIGYIINILLKRKIKEAVIRVLPIGLSFVLIIIFYSQLIVPLFKIELNNRYTLPATHWIMMGTNVENDGSFLRDDVLNSIDAKDKLSYNMSVISERIKRVNLKFYYNKLRRVWSQGDYGILIHYRLVDNFDETNYLLYGKGNILIRYLQQISKVTVYILFLLTIGSKLTKMDNDANSSVDAITISILVAILFYLIWEAQVRYSFTFLPWIIIGAAPSVYSVKYVVDLKSLFINRHKYNFEKVKQVFGLFIICLVILSLLFGFKDYVLKKEKQDIIRIDQPTGSSLYNIDVKKSKFEQYFRVKNSFNVITLLFDGQNIKEDIDYIFELYDNDDNLLYTKKFNTKWATSKKYINFYPKVKTDKEKEYHFIIYSKEATNDNYLTLWASTNDSCRDVYDTNNGYDINPNGESYYDNKLLCYNLRFSVIERKNKSLISAKVYVLYATIILLFLGISAYMLIYKNNRKDNIR